MERDQFRGFIGVLDNGTGKTFKARINQPVDGRCHKIGLNWAECNGCGGCGIEAEVAIRPIANGPEIHVIILQEEGTADYTLLPWINLEEGFYPVSQPVNF